jgi:hypothetical protein
MSTPRLHQPGAVSVPFHDLEAVKRWLSTVIDATLDELSPSEAIQLLDWLRDDVTCRCIEMGEDVSWPP